MARVILIGNSIARDMEVGGVTTISLPGRKLQEMGPELAMRANYKLVISGIPDIMPTRESTKVDGDMVTRYERQLARASNTPGVILCPFYPPRDLVAGQYGVINRLNQLICDLNAGKGFGTPKVLRGIFGRESRQAGEDRSDLYFRKEKLRDGAHPSRAMAASMSRELEDFVSRLPVVDLRDRISQDERQVEAPVAVAAAVRDIGLEREAIRAKERSTIDEADLTRDRKEAQAREKYRREMEDINEEYLTSVQAARRLREEGLAELQREETDRDRVEAEERRRAVRERDRRGREGELGRGRRREDRFREDRFRDIRDDVPRQRYEA